MFIVIGMIALFLYSSLVFYIGWSGWRWIRLKTASRLFKYLYIIVLTLAASSFILGRISDNSIIGIVGAYWMAVFYLLLVLLPVAQLTVRLLRLTRLPHHRTQTWAGFVILLLVVSTIAYGSHQAYQPVIKTYPVHIDKPTASLSSLKVVMAADMHFGLLSDKEHASRLVKEINALKPDLVLFPGDLVDDDIKPYVSQEIDRILAGIEAPYGVFATLGNHDRHDGSVEELINVLEQGGVTVLYDESVTIRDSLTLVGRRDRSDSGRAALSALMEGVDRSNPILLLDHQPYELDVAQKLGVDLVVSGHTHRGQVFPGNLITNAIYENDYGYLKKDQLHSIVTSGFGFWGPPIRIGTRSEIVQIQITFGS